MKHLDVLDLSYNLNMMEQMDSNRQQHKPDFYCIQNNLLNIPHMGLYNMDDLHFVVVVHNLDLLNIVHIRFL
jgi:hypothetical protein